jgi:serine/threonine protein kinase
MKVPVSGHAVFKDAGDEPTTLVEARDQKGARYAHIGTPCFMAPEVPSGDGGHTEKVDIGSLAATAIELATGSAPDATMHELDVVDKIVKARRRSGPETRTSPLK